MFTKSYRMKLVKDITDLDKHFINHDNESYAWDRIKKYIVALQNQGAVANEPPTAAAAPCPVHGDRYHLIEKLICDNCGLPI